MDRSPLVPELTLADFRGVISRQRWVMLAALVVSVAAVMAYTVWARPVYEASSMLRFEHEQVNLPQLVEQLTSESRISTEMEVLQGRTAADAVIDSLGLRAALQRPRKGRITRLFPTLRVAATADTSTLRFSVEGDSGYAAWREGDSTAALHAALGAPVTLAGVTLALSREAIGEKEIRLHIGSPEEALRGFTSALKVSRPARDADLIEVGFRAGDPELAARAANYLADHLITAQQAELERRTGLAVNFLGLQVDSVRAAMRVAEDKLQAYRERAKAVDPSEQARTQVGRLGQLQADRAGLEAERGALASLMQRIQLDSAASPDGPSPYRRLLGFPSILRNQAASELLSSLTTLENERSALLRRRTWLDPDVQSLTARIDALDAQLKGIATTYLEGLTSQVAGLDQAGHQFGRAMDSLPLVEIQTARLQREATILEELYATMTTRLKEAEIVRAVQDPAVRVVDRAFRAARPIRPKPALNLALSLILGGMLGLCLSLGREMLDKSVRSRADALGAAGLPVLGAFPRVGQRGFAARSWRRLRPREAIPDALSGEPRDTDSAIGPRRDRTATDIASLLVTQPGIPAAYIESFNQLFANLALAYRERPLKVVVFTSPLPGEGKTLSAINFALMGASRGLRMVLIDADLRCGVISTVLGCSREPGFAELLAGTAQVADVLRQIPVGEQGSLVVIPSGALPAVPGRLLTIERVREVLRALAPRFAKARVDFVVIDTPPVNLLADAALLASAADAVLLVVRAGYTQTDSLRFAMDQLEAAGAPVLGTLLNDIDLRRNAGDDGAYRYLAEAERYHVSAG